MFVRRIVAAFAAVVLLSLSLSGAVCDASCAFGQTQMPILATGQVHCQHETAAGEEQFAMQVSAPCHHQHACVNSVDLSVQRLRPMPPQLSLAAFTTSAHLQRREIVVMAQDFRIYDFANLLASIPSTSLRI